MNPKNYIPCVWRSTSRLDAKNGKITVSFETEDKTILRIQLDQSSARHLMETIDQYMVMAVGKTP